MRFLSGLLRCGACGGAMSIVSQRKVGLETFSQYGCSTYRSRGETACTNALTVSERKLVGHCLRETQTFIRSGEFEDWVEAATAEADRERQRPETDEQAQSVGDVRAQEADVEKITDALLAVGSRTRSGLASSKPRRGCPS